ncbi:hypothetical protein [Breoghania sp.]|uniref:hypothetical protein n=1 Tax=Breoghania sp. TaxID=2065378 RepID=UPI002AA61123|nr:hypothetical protein [Breoghania sp.]
MASISDYKRWEDEQDQADIGAAGLVLSAQSQSPDEAASDLNLADEFAKTTGNPRPPRQMVPEHRGEFQRTIDAKKNSTILSSSPLLTGWVRDPDNAAVAWDDLGALSMLDTLSRQAAEEHRKEAEARREARAKEYEKWGLTDPASTPEEGGPLSWVDRLVLEKIQIVEQWQANEAAERARDARMSFRDLLHDEGAFKNKEGKVVYEPSIYGPDDLFFAGTRWLNSQIATSLFGDQMQLAAAHEQKVGEIVKKIESIKMSPTAERGKQAWAKIREAGDFRAQFSAFMQSSADDPAGIGAFLAESAAPTVVEMLAILLVTKGAGSSLAVGGAVSAANTIATEAGTAPAEFFAENGIDISTHEGALKAVSDPQLMYEAAQRGWTRGVIISALDALSGGIAGKTLAKSKVFDFVLHSISDVFLASAGEGLAQASSGQDFNFADVMLAGLTTAATIPVGAAGDVGKVVYANVKRARAASNRVHLFEALSGSAKDSKLRARMPEAFGKYIDSLTVDGPIENIYVPADKFAKHFQDRGVDPFDLIDSLEGVSREDLDLALSGGSDLRIPTSSYATSLAGSEHDAFLRQNMRFDPDHMTASEAADYQAKFPEALDEARLEAEEMRKNDEEWRGVEQQIYDEVVSGLRVAGRGEDAARDEAAVWPAFYRVMAEKSGLTTKEFLSKYPLPQIYGAVPDGLQTKNPDELTHAPLNERTSDTGGIDGDGGEPISSIPATEDGSASVPAKKDGSTSIPATEDGQLGDEPSAVTDPILPGQEPRAPASVQPEPPVSTVLTGEGEAGNKQADEIGDESKGKLPPLDAAQPDDAGIVSPQGGDAETPVVGNQTVRNVQDKGQHVPGSIGVPGSGVGTGETIINLLESADASTFVHKTGPSYLTFLRDLAGKGEPNALDDLGGVKGWWRENAADLARDANKVSAGAPNKSGDGASGSDVIVTESDVIRHLDTGTSGDSIKDAMIDVAGQEQFARAFEQYLMNGKAPSAELRGAFERFRAWHTSLYKRLRGANVKINDELRGVFGRMLASDEEIRLAQSTAGDTGPVFASAEQMGMTEKEYQSFLKLRSQAEDDAKAQMLTEAMVPIRRERDKAYKAEKKEVAVAVEPAINAKPVYRAYEWLANNRWLGNDQPDLPEFKLSKEILVDRYGEGILATLRSGRRSVYASEGGADPDFVAGWFGFDSGDQMVKAIATAPKRKDAIKAGVERAMFERHGDLLRDGRAEQAALDKIHNDGKGDWLAAELTAIMDVAGTGTGVTMKEVRAAARQTVARMKVRDAMVASRFLAAERKAAQEASHLGASLAQDELWIQKAHRHVATKTRGGARDEGILDALLTQIDDANPSSENHNETVEKLIDAKRRQLMNHALYSEARKIADEVGKAESYVRLLTKSVNRKKIEEAGRREGAQIDYLSAIDDVLERYDLTAISGRAKGRRGALQGYAQAMTAAGRANELTVAEDVLRNAGGTRYKAIPIEELRGVIDTLKNLEHTAKRWNSLIDAAETRDKQETVAGLVAAMEKNLPSREPGRVTTRREALGNTSGQMLDVRLNAATILREIDGGEDGGAAYQALKSSIDMAMDRLTVRRERAVNDLDALYAPYPKKERRMMNVRQFVPELGYSLSKWEMIAIALNTGNEANLQRLTDKTVRGHLTERQVFAVLSRLDGRDARFIQSVWDYVGSFRSDIAARERRVTGTEPAWVDPKPVTIAGIELRGGYYPLKYDPRLSSLSRDDAAKDISDQLMAGRFGKAQTKRGHLEARAKSSGQSIDLDMSVLHRHVQEVVYDLELSEAVSNAWRVLQDGSVREGFINAGRKADIDALEIWLKDVAQGQSNPGDVVSRMARATKSDFTMAKLAFNLSTAVMQNAGLSQTMDVVGKKNYAHGVSAWVRRGGAMGDYEQDILARSPFMRERASAFNKGIDDTMNDPKLGPASSSATETRQEGVAPAAFWLMTNVQFHLVDIPTWLAGYKQGLEKFDNEAAAVAHADDIVKRAQASGLFSDRSANERGSISSQTPQSDVARLFTTLASYLFAKSKVANERKRVAGRDVSQGGAKDRALAAMSRTIDMAFLFTFGAVVTAAMKGRLPDSDGDKDEDGWSEFLAKETAMSFASTIPFIQDVSSIMSGFEGGAYGAVTKDGARTPKGLWDLGGAAFGGEGVTRSDVKAIINGAGLAAGAPTTFMNRGSMLA